jgi:hypothetical protein
MRWAGHVAHMREKINAYVHNFGSLERRRRRGEGNIKMDPKEIGFEDVNWIHLSQDRDGWLALVNKIINLRGP